MSPPLCAQCHAIFTGPRIPATPDPTSDLERWPHHISAAHMQRAVADGCVLCAGAWELFGIDGDADGEEEEEDGATPFTQFTLCSDFAQYRKGLDEGQLDVGGGVELGIERVPVERWHEVYVVHLFPVTG